jgi:hypothetical protein
LKTAPPQNTAILYPGIMEAQLKPIWVVLPISIYRGLEKVFFDIGNFLGD